MPSPKSGKAGAAVAPINPKNAEAADQANPGEVEKVKADQRQAQTGKYGSVKTKPYKPPKTGQEEETEKSWIEIELVDEDGRPVAGAEYRLTLPDGETVAEGSLDDKGLVRLDGIDPGTCRLAFPGLDADSWKKA